MNTKRCLVVILCMASILCAASAGCGKEKSKDETQIKKLVNTTPTPTVQLEKEDPENTKTEGSISMRNDYLDQKAAGDVPSVEDNSNASGDSSQEGAGQGADGAGDSTDGSGADLQDGSGDSDSDGGDMQSGLGKDDGIEE